MAPAALCIAYWDVYPRTDVRYKNMAGLDTRPKN